MKSPTNSSGSLPSSIRLTSSTARWQQPHSRIIVVGIILGIIGTLGWNYLINSSSGPTDLSPPGQPGPHAFAKLIEDQKRSRHSYKCSHDHMPSKLRSLIKRLEAQEQDSVGPFLTEFYIPEFAEVRKEMQDDPDWKKVAGAAATGNYGGAENMGVWTYHLNASRTLEVGFAGGGSATEFVGAHLSKKTLGQHISIDPYEIVGWKGHGVKYVKKLIEKRMATTTSTQQQPQQQGEQQGGPSVVPVIPPAFKTDPYIKVVDGTTNIFAWYEEASTLALSLLAKRHEKFDIIFLDGGHWFEDNIGEGAIALRLLNKQGIMILHDMWMPSVQSALNYMLTNLGCCLVLEQDNVAVLMPAAKKREWTSYWNFDCLTEKKE